MGVSVESCVPGKVIYGSGYKKHNQINAFFLILQAWLPEMFIRPRDPFSPKVYSIFRLKLEEGSRLALYWGKAITLCGTSANRAVVCVLLCALSLPSALTLDSLCFIPPPASSRLPQMAASDGRTFPPPLQTSHPHLLPMIGCSALHSSPSLL